tara:strand:+ start:244 stop:456 length:213 start_codon:yes stop_codon:yes gene_type:complete
MDPVDHTKTKQLLIDLSRRSIRTDNTVLAMQHAQKRGYLASDETPTKFGSTVASYLGFNSELMDRMNYGS